MIEAADGVDELTADIPRKDWIAVAAGPERSKARPTLCEHIPGELEATKCRVGPLRKVARELLAPAEWQLVNAIGDEAVAGDEGIAREVVVGVELVVRGAAEARVSGVKAAALLIQQRVARIKGEAVGEATIDLGLERVRPPAAEIGVPREVRSQFRERAAGRIRLRDNAVAVIRATGIAVLVARAERRGVGR